jgi:hypothetical protein
LGAAIAILLPMTGGDPHAPAVYWISLGFTFIGAAVFSTIRGHRARIPQEAIHRHLLCRRFGSRPSWRMSKGHV